MKKYRFYWILICLLVIVGVFTLIWSPITHKTNEQKDNSTRYSNISSSSKKRHAESVSKGKIDHIRVFIYYYGRKSDIEAWHIDPVLINGGISGAYVYESGEIGKEFDVSKEVLVHRQILPGNENISILVSVKGRYDTTTENHAYGSDQDLGLYKLTPNVATGQYDVTQVMTGDDDNW